MDSKRAKLREVEWRGYQESEWGWNGKLLVKRYKLPVTRLTSFGDLM